MSNVVITPNQPNSVVVSGSISNITVVSTGSLTATITPSTIETVTVATPGPQGSTGQVGPLPDTGSFVQISQTSSMAVGSATNADNAYVDFGATNSSYRIPMVTGTPGDGYFQLKSPSNEIYYYLRLTNPVSGVSQQADQLNIGGGSNTAGGIFLNSTVGIPSYLYSDGPLHLYSQGYKVQLSSSANEIELVGNTKITGSLNLSGSFTAPEITASHIDITSSDSLNLYATFTETTNNGFGTQKLKRPTPALVYSPDTTNFISGESEKAAQLSWGSNSPARAGAILLTGGPSDPNYIRAFNADLWVVSPKSVNLSGSTDIQMHSEVHASSSVTIDDVLKLSPQDPLPTGEIGMLATSGSNLFFYNGAWTQIV